MISKQWVYLNLTSYLPHTTLKESSGVHSWCVVNSVFLEWNKIAIPATGVEPTYSDIYLFCRLFRVMYHQDLHRQDSRTVPYGGCDVKELLQEACPKAAWVESWPRHTPWEYLPRCMFFSALHGMGLQGRLPCLCNDVSFQEMWQNHKPYPKTHGGTSDIQMPGRWAHSILFLILGSRNYT